MNTVIPDIPSTPVTGPSLWTPVDLHADQSWKVAITMQQRDELAIALELVRDLPLESIDLKSASLPAWQPITEHINDELTNGRGVVLVRGLDARNYSVDDLQRIFWMIAIRIGRPMVQNAKGELLGHVVDRGHDYDANNVRGYTTNRALAFHCDASQAVGLLCVHPAKSGGTSPVSYTHLTLPTICSV